MSSSRDSRPSWDWEDAQRPPYKKHKTHTSDAYLEPRTRKQALCLDDLDIGKALFEWTALFDRKAPLMRMTLATQADNPSCLSFSPTAIRKLKYFTQAETVCSEVCEVLPACSCSLGWFEDEVEWGCPGFTFESTLIKNSLLWQQVRTWITDALVYNTEYGKPPGWSMNKDLTVPAFKQMDPPEAALIISAVRIAFKTDMRNGEANCFLQEICNSIVATLNMQNIVRLHAPSTAAGLNTKVELLAEDSVNNFNRPYTNEPPIPSYEDMDDNLLYFPAGTCRSPAVKAHKVVTDFIGYTTVSSGSDKGKFFLVVEISPEAEVDAAVFQCYKQLLSKMFFQNFMFGIVITPVRFVLIYAWKHNNRIRTCDFTQRFVARQGPDSNNYDIKPFDVDVLFSLINWLCGIMQYVKDSEQGIKKDYR